jgi:hypothetical protein
VRNKLEGGLAGGLGDLRIGMDLAGGLEDGGGA